MRPRFKFYNYFFDRQLVPAVQVSTHCRSHVHAPQKLVNLGAVHKRRLQLGGVENWSKWQMDGTKNLLTWGTGVSKVRKKLPTLELSTCELRGAQGLLHDFGKSWMTKFSKPLATIVGSILYFYNLLLPY